MRVEIKYTELVIALEIPSLLLHHSPRWRDGRVVECTGLENQQGVKTFQGSNPCPSAIYYSQGVRRRFLSQLFIAETNT